MTRCIDPVPFAWVDRVFFQADVSYILDWKRSNLASPIAVEEWKYFCRTVTFELSLSFIAANWRLEEKWVCLIDLIECFLTHYWEFAGCKRVGNQHLNASYRAAPWVVRGQIADLLALMSAGLDQQGFELLAVSNPQELSIPLGEGVCICVEVLLRQKVALDVQLWFILRRWFALSAENVADTEAAANAAVWVCETFRCTFLPYRQVLGKVDLLASIVSEFECKVCVTLQNTFEDGRCTSLDVVCVVIR